MIEDIFPCVHMGGTVCCGIQSHRSKLNPELKTVVS